VIWNPWRRVREHEEQIDLLERHIAELQRALGVSADRYELVREMNAQLRQTLELYRKAG
jgi:hypothetical protein